MIKKLIPILFLLITLCLIFTACKDKHEHNYVETIFTSTCKEMGYTQKLCTDCGDELLFDYKPRSGHNGDNWQLTKAPTCQGVGTEERICLTCNIVFETRSVAKLGHTGGAWTVTKQPTCNDTGIEKLFCSFCGIDLETKTLTVTDEHNFATTVTLPTTTSEGYTTYVCKICDFSKKDDYVSKIEVIEELDASDIYELASKAMVRIDVYDKNDKRYALGSGFFISSDGKIVTNYHVIQAAHTLKATLYSDNTTHTVVNVLGYDKAKDVAIIQIDLENTSYLEISTGEVKTGDTVYTLGSPKGVDNIFSSGIVSNPSKMVSGKECIAFTAPISSGNSGGPLINDKGQVIGINTMTVTDSQNLNFAIMAKQITSLNTENPITPAALYTQKLKENAFEILYINIMINAQTVSDDQYIIYKNTPETSTNVGFDYYYVADSEKESITVRIYIVKGGKRTHMVELTIGSVAEQYDFSMYDIALGQYTIEATANAGVKPSSYETDFINLFNMYSFRYIEGDTTSPDGMKQIFFLMYTVTLDGMKNYLSNSNTELTISHFNFNY